MIEDGKKGAKITAEKRAREFTLMSPKGEVHHGRNLTKFCGKHNLDHANIRRVLSGVYKNHKGWTLHIKNALTDTLFSSSHND
jgi:hypothetical protein